MTIEDLERRLETTLTYYLCFHPHRRLEGATPTEVFLGVEPACKNAATPPRGRPGEGPQEPPVTIGFLAGNRAFPLLKKTT